MKRRRPKPLPPQPLIEGYLDQKSRMDYLRQKLAAEGRMEVFDELPPDVRTLATAAQKIGDAVRLRHLGVRTFDEAERAIAGLSLTPAKE